MRNKANVIKFQSPFERLKLYTSSPDITLRRAIITQAIIDATNISACRKAKKLEQEAKSWIFGGDEYFKATCIEGDIEPSFVTRVTKDLIKIHNRQSKVRRIDKSMVLEAKNAKELRNAM